MNIKKVKDVLILVLMEDTLREGACRQVLELRIVLILVLMEDTLRAVGTPAIPENSAPVLILVLMEDTLRGGQFPRYIRKANAS